MYEAGGITFLDTEFLINAVLNMGSHAIGSTVPDLLQQIQTVLSAGAIMGMFETGFADTQKMVTYIEQQFDTGVSPNFVQLIHVNNLYIPLSYLLQNIAERVQKLFMDIINNAEGSSMTSSKFESSVEFGNFANLSFIPRQEEDATTRWATVRDKGIQQTTMHIKLAAGILDILEQISNLGKFK